MFSFFGNAGSILGLSVPLATLPELTIRLHFWLLLYFLFDVIGIIQSRQPLYYAALDCLLIVGLLLVHEWGHRVLARTVGGNHWEFILWPLGGMTTPQAPHRPWATFVANIGGIVFSLPVGLAALGMVLLLAGTPSGNAWRPGSILSGGAAPATFAGAALVMHLLNLTIMLSATIVAINLFPAYLFDGGNIWQAILWPKFGQHRAITITCMAGMILSALLFLLSLLALSLFGMIFWALIFSSCFNRRRALLAAGPGVVDEDEGYNYMDTGGETRPRRKIRKGWFRAAARRAAKDRAEQERIDTILAKVHEKGLHALTWWEKRALRKATERQRQQDLVERY